MASSGKYDTEGSGANLAVWMPKPRERNRGRTVYVENECEEGSRQLTDPPQEERGHLRATARSSSSHFGDSFFKNAASATLNTPEGEGGGRSAPSGGGKQQSQIMDQAPKQCGKLNKELLGIQKVMRDVVRKLEENLKSTHGVRDKDDPELQSYRKTAILRLRLGKVWMAGAIDDAKELVPASLSQFLTLCGIQDKDMFPAQLGNKDADVGTTAMAKMPSSLPPPQKPRSKRRRRARRRRLARRRRATATAMARRIARRRTATTMAKARSLKRPPAAPPPTVQSSTHRFLDRQYASLLHQLTVPIPLSVSALVTMFELGARADSVSFIFPTSCLPHGFA